MHHGEQLRHLLHLIKDNLGGGGVARDQLPQALRLGAVGPKGFGIEQIEAERFGIVGLRPERFAGPAWSEEEEAAGSQLGKTGKRSPFRDAIWSLEAHYAR